MNNIDSNSTQKECFVCTREVPPVHKYCSICSFDTRFCSVSCFNAHKEEYHYPVDIS